MKAFFIITLSIFLLSCSKTRDTETAIDTIKAIKSADLTTTDSTTLDATINYEDYFKLESYLTTNIIDSSQMQTIDLDCYISIYPTEEQVEELKKEVGKDNFYTVADDNNWYQSLALETLDSIQVNQQIITKPFIRFIGEHKTWTLSVRKKTLPEWNLILFNKNKEPKIVSTINFNLDTAKKYFEIRN